MAETNLDIILRSMGRSQDPNFDDILSGMGGVQTGVSIVAPIPTPTPTPSGAFFADPFFADGMFARA